MSEDDAKNQPKEVSRSKLIIGVMNSLDVSNNVTDVLKFNDDMNRANKVDLEIKNLIGSSADKAIKDIYSLATKNGQTILNGLMTDFVNVFGQITQQNRATNVQSAGGYRMTANLMGQYTKYYAQFNKADLASKCLFDLPETYVLTQVKRYLNGAFGLNRFNDKDAWILYRNGYVTPTYILDSYRGENGYNLEDAQKLMKIKDYQVGKPDARTAWRWVRKGLVPREYFTNICMLGNGMTKQEADILFEDLDYDVTVGDVMNLSQFVPLDSAWMDTAFNNAGFKEADKLIFKTAIEKKVIRDEIKGLWGQILNFCQYGFYSDAQLTSLLQTWHFSPSEIDIKIRTAQIVQEKLVSQLMRDADIYLFRKGTITAQQLYERLIAMGISQTVSNAITRNENAKLGIDWELGE